MGFRGSDWKRDSEKEERWPHGLRRKHVPKREAEKEEAGSSEEGEGRRVDEMWGRGGCRCRTEWTVGRWGGERERV